jgi:hypothetical protein
MPTVHGLETLARIGFAARGILYATIGFLALWAGRSEDGAGALARLSSEGGRILLGLMALGFVGYALWRLSDAILDSEGHGGKAGGLAVRAGGAASGLAHLGLAFLAASMAAGRSNGSGGDSSRDGAATLLSWPGGEIAVLLAAAALGVTAAFQFVRAGKGDFVRRLDPAAAQRPWVRFLGRAGYAARGAVFLAMALFLLKAGLESDAGEAGGMGKAIEAFGTAPRIAVAAGLLLFGLFSLVEARYRRITDPKVIERLAHRGRRVAGRLSG